MNTAAGYKEQIIMSVLKTQEEKFWAEKAKKTLPWGISTLVLVFGY